MIPVNYLKSHEIWRNAQIIGTQSIPYIVILATQGYSHEVALGMVFTGFFGGMAIAKTQIDSTPNLYLPKAVPLTRNPLEAVANSVQATAVEEAIKVVSQNNDFGRIVEDVKKAQNLFNIFKGFVK